MRLLTYLTEVQLLSPACHGLSVSCSKAVLALSTDLSTACLIKPSAFQIWSHDMYCGIGVLKSSKHLTDTKLTSIHFYSSNYLSMVPSSCRNSKQCEATTQWLNKPSVLEAQWEKAHLCTAWQTRNHERKKNEALAEVNVHTDGPIDSIPDQYDLDKLWLSIGEWKSDWGPEGKWLKKYDKSLHKAHEKGLANTDHFFKECEIHACEGHHFLHLL
ncbi:hypothetical protein EDC04DRAFT_2610197 [Pisolithus marmoratus]|nr:hypothetical protein EDC04DRAFT_2610197 [Pisolithus marmoratus]